MFSLIAKINWSLCKNGIIHTQIESVHYRATELWKSVLSVSNQGSKKGRGKRRGRTKDLNMGQVMGDGKMLLKYPGLNTQVSLKNAELTRIQVVGEDTEREKRLTEIRNSMDKFKRISIGPFERGFSGSSLAGKPIGPPVSYDDGEFD